MGDVVKLIPNGAKATETGAQLEDRLTAELYTLLRGYPAWIAHLALLNVLGGIALNFVTDESMPLQY
jgi:hypothetical protein